MIRYIDRQTKKEEVEKVYGEFFISLLYGKNLFSRFLYTVLLPLLCKNALGSKLYGILQKTSRSRRKILPFIEKFHVDSSEFLEPVEAFTSFNDFFIRKLKPSSRPIASGHDVAVMPADARCLVFPHIDKADGFLVKGEKFCLNELLQDKNLAHKYHQGSMFMARLCPTDYHRFHFPCNGIPEKAQLINGALYSVNPAALKKNIHIFTQNKRMLTLLHTKNFGTIAYIEIGATAVGTIQQTYIPDERCAKGDEKGYFSFGGSSLILLFEPFRIQFDQDLLDASNRRLEMRALMGQSLGRALSIL